MSETARKCNGINLKKGGKILGSPYSEKPHSLHRKLELQSWGKLAAKYKSKITLKFFTPAWTLSNAIPKLM
jgi:hypothetical protein